VRRIDVRMELCEKTNVRMELCMEIKGGLGATPPTSWWHVLKVRGRACEHPCRRHGQKLVLVLITGRTEKEGGVI
jgi:hypothetical protein